MAQLTAPESITERLRIDHATERKRSSLRRRLLPIVALLSVLAAAAVFAMTRPPTVTVAQVRAERPGERVTELTASGYVASRRRSIVAPKIAGRLEQLLVEEGERVEAGQVLARLDDDEERVAVMQAKAAAGTARARVARARALAEQARLELARTRPLVESGALARKLLDDTEAAHDAAAAEARAAAADLATSDAAIAAAELRLDHTTVRAPYAGTVVRKLADEGAVLAPATIAEVDVGGIVELVDLDALEVEAEVSEDQLSRIEQGQPALVFLDAYPDKVFRGVTGTVRPAVDRAKATAVVKVRFEEVPPGALPDMGVKVAFLEKDISKQELEGKSRLRVPAGAVMEREGQSLLVTIEDGRAKLSPVVVVERTGTEVVLDSGPPPGTKLAVGFPKDVRDGQRLRVQAEPS